MNFRAWVFVAIALGVTAAVSFASGWISAGGLRSSVVTVAKPVNTAAAFGAALASASPRSRTLADYELKNSASAPSAVGAEGNPSQSVASPAVLPLKSPGTMEVAKDSSDVPRTAGAQNVDSVPKAGSALQVGDADTDDVPNTESVPQSGDAGTSDAPRTDSAPQTADTDKPSPVAVRNIVARTRGKGHPPHSRCKIRRHRLLHIHYPVNHGHSLPRKEPLYLPKTIHDCGIRRLRRLAAGHAYDGGNGAWELPPNTCYYLDLPLARGIAAIARGKSLTELGAGLGCYVSYFVECGVQVIAAVDGAKNVQEMTGDVVHQWDLTKPMEATADWVMSMEVAEHIPANLQHAFLDNLVRNARCGIILSWAAPHKVERGKQSGSGHENEKDPHEVQAIMTGLGMTRVPSVTRWLREQATLTWFWRSLTVYYRNNTVGCDRPEVPSRLMCDGSVAPNKKDINAM